VHGSTTQKLQTDEGRAVCYRCHKPELTCICGHVRRVANRTLVWIAQHPRERFHPIGTARIARLGLDNVRIETVRPGTPSAPSSLPAGAGLLYPGANARDIASLEPDERPDALVLIDGTWSHACTLYRDSPWLQRLPHYRLEPRHESRYRLRKEPAAHCVSTIEAVVEALRFLEPNTSGLDDLLTSFDTMIDQQLALIEQHQRGPRGRQVPRTHRGVPRAVLDAPERLVAVSFEAAPRGSGGDDAVAIVHCVAVRVATGETFEHFVRPPPGRFPTPRHLHHMGLNAEPLAAGTTTAELRDHWHRFVAADDIVVAWNKTTLDALDATVGLSGRRLHLKSAYRSHAKQARGSLATLVRQLQLEPSRASRLRGRAGTHVDHVVALLATLQPTRRSNLD